MSPDTLATCKYPEAVRFVPEALVKLSVGNVPNPDALMLVDDTFAMVPPVVTSSRVLETFVIKPAAL
ncbi:MAG: hypothetical protein HY433_02600 [Candidatus Liptonbacteria bacterium]|nr:hypothetical protein [Candidatus Liptonbacteria bacterium]